MFRVNAQSFMADDKRFEKLPPDSICFITLMGSHLSRKKRAKQTTIILSMSSTFYAMIKFELLQAISQPDKLAFYPCRHDFHYLLKAREWQR